MPPLLRHFIALLCIVFGTTGALLYVVHRDADAYIYTTVSEAPTAEAALVLGASVIGTSTLSHVLAQRADRSIELYQAHKVAKIIVTGDNSALSHNEVDPVGKYLVARGIPKSDIFLDHAGFDTYSSMYRARDVFHARSIIIVSQPFHLPRAVFIARTLGLSAVGVAVDTDESYLFNRIREIPATLKALWDVCTYRSPKYLGPSIPISGGGEGTWPQPATTSAILYR